VVELLHVHRHCGVSVTTFCIDDHIYMPYQSALTTIYSVLHYFTIMFL